MQSRASPIPASQLTLSEEAGVFLPVSLDFYCPGRPLTRVSLRSVNPPTLCNFQLRRVFGGLLNFLLPFRIGGNNPACLQSQPEQPLILKPPSLFQQLSHHSPSPIPAERDRGDCPPYLSLVFPASSASCATSTQGFI